MTAIGILLNQRVFAFIMAIRRYQIGDHKREKSENSESSGFNHSITPRFHTP